MRRLTITALAIAAGLLLTGCGAAAVPAADSSPSSKTTPTASSTPTTSAGPVEVAAATPEPPTEADSILVAIQLTVASYEVDVKADQIRAASDYVCDQLAAGTPEDQIVALTGDIPEGANRDLVQLAADDYCPVR